MVKKEVEKRMSKIWYEGKTERKWGVGGGFSTTESSNLRFQILAGWPLPDDVQLGRLMVSLTMSVHGTTDMCTAHDAQHGGDAHWGV